MDVERRIGCVGVVGVMCGAGAKGLCGKGWSVRSVVVVGSGEFRVWGVGLMAKAAVEGFWCPAAVEKGCGLWSFKGMQ